jgi:signal transduction histidine kinase
MRDLTHWKNTELELKEARREAERASALKSDFLAKVSHEIRTPLNAILGFAEVMMSECFGPIGNQRYQDYVKGIHASGTLITSLVDDLLDLAKIEAGKMEFTFESVDANRIVSDCAAIMEPQAKGAGVKIRLSLSQALPNILADERSLRQIVLNLLSNAVKFNRPQGQVHATTGLNDSGSVVIRVRDTGIGMPEGSIGTAFEPFRRLAGGQPSSGTGLGLPLTKALAEANCASLVLRSKEHEGTLAEVIFARGRIRSG